ncbi:hypothetical protein L9F63_004506 [Diploptera punctata]|uniref:Ionotropic glutamate receptor C-terminal domain-containing protein n=1 Tax=Diploptera punctata TaxID=6984 RepID=A0AAD7ZFU6_DIPPU|nr:hypothetical protein L9F63_004506 [Diploptera punctata]
MYVASLIGDFFLNQHIRQVVLFVCWGLDSAHILKELSGRGIRISVPSWMENVTSVNKALEVSENIGTVGAVFDISCTSKQNTVLWAFLMQIFQSVDVHWLLFSSDDWKKIKHTTPVNQTNVPKCSITIAKLNCFPVIPLFQIKSLHNLIDMKQKQAAGYWSRNSGLRFTSNTSDNNELRSLKGTVLKMTAVSPFTAHQNRQMYDSNLLQLLAEILDFRLQEAEARGRFKKSTDLWILQQLMSGHADISGSSILVTHDRVGLAEYTIAVEKFLPQLYYKVQSVRAARNIYILPFSIEVWAVLCALLLSITIALTLIFHHESKLHEQEEQEKEIKMVQPKWDFDEVLLVTIGAVCQQGSAHNPTTSAARTVFIVLFVLAVVTFTAYSASVISLLSSPSSVTSTLQGILRSGSKMGLALLNIHYYHSHFKREENAVSHELHKAEVPVSPVFLELADGLESTLKGEIAFCADKVETYTYLHNSHQTEETLCSIGEIPLLQGPQYQRSFALPLKSPYKTTINYGLLRLIQFGLVVRERRRWFQVMPLCDTPDPPPGTSYLSIALDDICPALYLIFIGLACGCVLIPLEYTFHFCIRVYKRRYINRKRSKWIRRQFVLQRAYNRKMQRKSSVWWIGRAWQKFRQFLSSEEPFPFVH